MRKFIKYSSLSFIVLSLLLVSSCNNDSGVQGGEAFIGGSTGLTLKFMDGQPPDYIYKLMPS